MDANRKTLTTLEAANIGREMGVRGLCIYRDDLDRDLWRVVTPGRNEVHEPMDEPTWRAFIAASGWIARPSNYEAKRRNGAQGMMAATLERIAREELEITTLESRHSDQEDFHTLAVWEIATVMERAYQAGFEAARNS